MSTAILTEYSQLVAWSEEQWANVATWQFGTWLKDHFCFRKGNTKAIRLVCRDFVVICRKLDLFSNAFAAINDNKFKTVNNNDNNFTHAKKMENMWKLYNYSLAYIEKNIVVKAGEVQYESIQ